MRTRFSPVLLVLVALALPAQAVGAPTLSGPVTALPGVDIRVNAPWIVGGGFPSTSSITAAGDVNGDGRDDVFVRLSRPGGAAVYVVFGAPGTAPVQLESIGSRGFYLWRPSTTALVATPLGDVTGDGRDDFAAAGALIYGRTATTPINLGALSPADGRPGQSSQLPVGDLNGDGHTDHTTNGIDATGSTITFGTPGDTPSTTSLRILLPADGPCGRKVPTPAGDVNGDGRDDLVISAEASVPIGNSTIGTRTCVLYGQGPGTIDTRTFSTTGKGFAINAGWWNPPFNTSGYITGATPAAGVGDVNGDGRDDIAIAKPWEEPLGRPGAGTISVVPGGSRSGLFDARSVNRLSMQGTAASSQLGSGPIFGISDVTGDGRGEVIVTERSGSVAISMPGRPLTGAVDLANLGTAGLRVTGIAGMTPVGDFDGDGTTDIAASGRIILTGAL